MAHSKSFPKEEGNSTRWHEVTLSLAEEQAEEEKARKENISLMKRCLDDASGIMRARSLQPYQSDLVLMAVTLFGKMASHSVYWKDSRCKEKFDRLRRG